MALVLLGLAGCDAADDSEDTSADTASEDSSTDTTSPPVDPAPYVLDLEAGTESASWASSAGTWRINVCAVLLTEPERTLRVYPVTYANQTPYCADADAWDHAVLRFTGRFVQTEGEGTADVTAGQGAELVEAPSIIRVDMPIEPVTVDIFSEGDSAAAPARLRVGLEGWRDNNGYGLNFTFTNLSSE